MNKVNPNFKVCEKCKMFRDTDHDGSQYLYCDWKIMAARPINMEWNPEAEDGLGDKKYSRMQRTKDFTIPESCGYILEHSIK